MFTVEALDQAEDHIVCAAVTDEGDALEEDVASRLWSLPGEALGIKLSEAESQHDLLEAQTKKRQEAIQRQITERNAKLFEQEVEKLDCWADDLKLGLEREIKDLDRQIKEARRLAMAAPTLEDKVAGQKQVKTLELRRSEKRRSLFDAQDEIDKQREQLISGIEGKLNQQSTLNQLLYLRWNLS